MARAEVPHADGQREETCGDYRHKGKILRRNGMAEQPHAGIKRRKAKRNDPAQKELHRAGVNRERITPEGNYVPDGRVNADAVFEPK